MSDAVRAVANITDERFEANIGGVGVSVKTSMVTSLITGLRNVPGSVWFAIALMLALMLGMIVFGAWYVAGHAIPMALNIINEGHAARDASHAKNLEQVTTAHTKDLEKLIATFEKNADQTQKHNREILDVLKERLTPIAVNPAGS